MELQKRLVLYKAMIKNFGEFEVDNWRKQPKGFSRKELISNHSYQAKDRSPDF